jgi:hypothetical protein
VNEIQSGERAGTETRFPSKILPGDSRNSVSDIGGEFPGVAKASPTLAATFRKSQTGRRNQQRFSGSCKAVAGVGGGLPGIAATAPVSATVLRELQSRCPRRRRFSGSCGGVASVGNSFADVAEWPPEPAAVLRAGFGAKRRHFVDFQRDVGLVFASWKMSEGTTALIPTFSPRRRRKIESTPSFSCSLVVCAFFQNFPGGTASTLTQTNESWKSWNLCKMK